MIKKIFRDQKYFPKPKFLYNYENFPQKSYFFRGNDFTSIQYLKTLGKNITLVLFGPYIYIIYMIL